MPKRKRPPDSQAGRNVKKKPCDTDCTPFWNRAAAKLSRRLIPHTGPEYSVELDWSSWIGNARTALSASAFKTQWRQPLHNHHPPAKYYWLSRSLLWQRVMDKEVLKRRTHAKARNKGQTKDYDGGVKVDPTVTFRCSKHKILHNPLQVQLFRKWFGVYRWTYNQCCSLLRTGVITGLPSLKQLRSLVVNIKAVRERYPDQSNWVLKVPYDLRDKAVVEFHKNLKLQLSLGKSLSDFNMDFKSKKAKSQAVEIDVKNWHGGCPFPTQWKMKKRCVIKFESRRHGLRDYTIQDPRYALRLLYERGRRWYQVAIPVKIQIPKLKVHDSQVDYKTVFLDPGVRTFLTGFDSDGRVLELGVGYEKLVRMCKALDTTISDAAKQNHHKRYRIYNRVLPRMRRRIKNVVGDLHWKTAKFLCSNYSDIHLPVFSSSRMLKKKPVRYINSKTARMMCTWSHYRFQQILKYRAETRGCRLFIANEAYTSRTCCVCGFLKPKSSSKISECQNCRVRLDRDINGAICICLRQCTFAGA